MHASRDSQGVRHRSSPRCQRAASDAGWLIMTHTPGLDVRSASELPSSGGAVRDPAPSGVEPPGCELRSADPASAGGCCASSSTCVASKRALRDWCRSSTWTKPFVPAAPATERRKQQDRILRSTLHRETSSFAADKQKCRGRRLLARPARLMWTFPSAHRCH